MEVYINDIAAFLPNEPVENDEIEKVLGAVNNIPSRIKNRILKNNGIEKRYYSIDRKTGELNYTNAQLTAEAIRRLKEAAAQDILIGGANLAAQAFRAGLIDECHFFLASINLGGGKPALPQAFRLELELLDVRRFGSGVVHLHYRTRKGITA